VFVDPYSSGLQAEQKRSLLLGIFGIIALQLYIVNPVEIHSVHISDQFRVSPPGYRSRVVEKAATAFIKTEVGYECVPEALRVWGPENTKFS
jgi:hypothetical protein